MRFLRSPLIYQWGMSLRCSAADEMHNLDAVAIVERDFSPLCAGYNFAVVLDGESSGSETEMRDEIAEAHPVRRFTAFAVEFDVHLFFGNLNPVARRGATSPRARSRSQR